MNVVLMPVRHCIKSLDSWNRWLYINCVRLLFGKAKRAKLTDIEILYQSDHFLVVNKRHDIRINSELATDVVTVATQLQHLHPNLVSTDVSFGFWFPHRLDYATSGALCLALKKKAAALAGQAFSKHYTTKHYLALVRGHVENSVQHVDVPIGPDRTITDHAKMKVFDSSSIDSTRRIRNSCTTIILLERGFYNLESASKVLLIPHTGRTHQLRLHCAHIGHTIVGDYNYSNRQDVMPYRMMLHAYRLIIPMKHEHIDITTKDAFTTDIDSLWQCKEIIRTYGDCVNNIEHLMPESFYTREQLTRLVLDAQGRLDLAKQKQL